MLDITVRTENAERHVRPSARELEELVRRIGARGDNFLVLQRVPDLPDVFAQVWHEHGGDYAVEHRGPAGYFEATAGEPATVAAVLVGWARRESGWDSRLTWSPLDAGPEREVPPLDLADGERAELEDRVREVLAGGYASREDLAEVAEEYLVTGDRRPVSRPQARELADRLWLERVAEQESWQGETDPERLTRAFAALEAAGITARENFTCCRTCGNAEIGDEALPGARGFVYFHAQSTEAAAAGHGLTLHYGGFDGSAGTTTAVGAEVVTALEAAGLPAEWNRDPGRAITVTPLRWHRRLVG
ncbi:DUF6891 domain-containing protein [Lentzea sp. NPDC059081]|uniref:DUF6891 domain-containing protein n=1 Tax=Lentzea sp. NPDC059081 TaxID=3346719 RepID=UPI0036B33082